MLGYLKKVLDPNEKEIKRLRGTVAAINALEPEMQGLTDEQLSAKTAEFKERIARGASLDDLLPEAFAVVREASRRTLGMRHFDVQLMGGMVLHEGRIAEMKTGEGKTLVATLPAYLNALAGRGVHVVTVNEYLAKRDAEWMGTIYKFLGLSVGVILHALSYAERKAAYAADITYGTNNEFGFDYLRDNMVWDPGHMVQRDLAYAIVDEVDSILIDEARTPLIISGPAEQSTEHYYRFAKLVPRLVRDEDYTVDEKARQVALTESGVAKMEQWLGVDNLYDDENYQLTHYLNQALKAHALFKRDRDYVVKDGQVIIVDEFTGRLMFGRRYSDGLHQSIEAKEGVKIERESQTLATITFQNYFRMYDKLAGMTGTAATEEAEFRKIYGMDVVVIPTNRPNIRIDYPDVVYKTEKAKFQAVVDEIAELYEKGRPVLVGTISIEKSERLSEMLKRRGIPHQVLNAKYHEREAEIVAQAGKYKAVTIATNMAGRGTDILLGGNPDFLARERMRNQGFTPEEIAAAQERWRPLETLPPRIQEARQTYDRLLEEARAELAPDAEKVRALGGLHVLGTERHESRRIDNQLRGRTGRQGDPGSSRFYVSLEDDLMRLFGSERIMGLMDRLGWEDDQPIEHNQITRAIENAQKKVEARNFEMRKTVLEYDDVMNKQREVIYAQRRKVLRGESLRESFIDMFGRIVDAWLQLYADPKVHIDEWDFEALAARAQELAHRPDIVSVDELKGAENRQALRELLLERLTKAYEAREAELGADMLRQLERMIMLRVMDAKWMEHLRAMDDLREGIGLRAYGQKDPLLEYKFEAFNMFQEMQNAILEEVVGLVFRMQIVQQAAPPPPPTQPSPEDEAAIAAARARAEAIARARAEAEQRAREAAAKAEERLRYITSNREAQAAPQPRRSEPKVGRNDPCPCGSGKKYKKCHGAEA